MYRKKKKRTCTVNVQEEDEKNMFSKCTGRRRKEYVQLMYRTKKKKIKLFQLRFDLVHYKCTP